LPALAEHPTTAPRELKKEKSLSHYTVLRCMVCPADGSYTAECIDLDLMASGRTQLEAYQSLIGAITGYLDDGFKR